MLAENYYMEPYNIYITVINDNEDQHKNNKNSVSDYYRRLAPYLTNTPYLRKLLYFPLVPTYSKERGGYSG